MKDIRCMTSPGAVPVRQVEGDHLDARERLSQRLDASAFVR